MNKRLGALARAWTLGTMAAVGCLEPVVGAVPSRFHFKEPADTEYEVLPRGGGH